MPERGELVTCYESPVAAATPCDRRAATRMSLRKAHSMRSAGDRFEESELRIVMIGNGLHLEQSGLEPSRP
jgi:hypothetical protein